MAQFLKKQLKSAISSTNHLLGRYRDKILILGDGRSGTNWLLEIINYDKRLRLIYEPFHGAEFRPKLSPDIEYPSADAKLAAELSTQLSRAARGAYLTKNVTIEFPRLFYDGLIIKDVNAHLIADDLDQAMPDLKKVLILRHPFAVALSKSRYKGHSWPTPATYFLREDVALSNSLRYSLAARSKIIERASQHSNPVLNWVCIWCILHSALFSAKSIASYHVVLYEDFVREPALQAQPLFRALGQSSRYQKHHRAILDNATRPSRVTQKDNVIANSVAGNAAWLADYDSETISHGMEILEGFGMDRLYIDQHFPKLSADLLSQALTGNARSWLS